MRLLSSHAENEIAENTRESAGILDVFIYYLGGSKIEFQDKVLFTVVTSVVVNRIDKTCQERINLPGGKQ